MTLEEAKDEFERRFKRVFVGNPSYRSQTGEIYTTIYSGGPTMEGESHGTAKRFFDTPEETVEVWRKTVSEYAASHPGKFLYWREIPEMDEWKGKYRIYSRLLISNKLADVAA